MAVFAARTGFAGGVYSLSYCQYHGKVHHAFQQIISETVESAGAVAFGKVLDVDRHDLFLKKLNVILRTAIISFTQNYLEWLPGNSLYEASPTAIKDRMVVACGHPITEGVKEYDMNYRCGVKGFFNRGFFKAPEGAAVILKDSDGECVAYIDAATTKGVILSTAGADLVGFGLAESSTAKRLGVNLMLWLEKTMREREAA